MTQSKFEQANSEILAIYTAAGKNIPDFESDEGEAVNILQSIIDQNHSLEEPEIMADGEDLQEYQENITAEYSELFDVIDEITSHIGEDDFYIDYDGNEYRFISDSFLWCTYVEEIKYTVSDCYDLKLDKLPSFVAFAIDWEETARNCLVDGYAHTFSSYDGEFHVEASDYNVFWTN